MLFLPPTIPFLNLAGVRVCPLALQSPREPSALLWIFSVSLPEKMATAHAARGQSVLSAPLFGRPDAAAAGKLFVAAAGAPDAVDNGMHLFDAIGQDFGRGE